MIKIKFKNLDESELAREAVCERFAALTEKFPKLDRSQIDVTLQMENSPIQTGPDLFRVSVAISGGEYSSIRIEKENSNLYIALADLSEHMLEVLNRAGDRARVKERRAARRIIQRRCG